MMHADAASTALENPPAIGRGDHGLRLFPCQLVPFVLGGGQGLNRAPGVRLLEEALCQTLDQQGR